jgi:hypothetical protein
MRAPRIKGWSIAVATDVAMAADGGRTRADRAHRRIISIARAQNDAVGSDSLGSTVITPPARSLVPPWPGQVRVQPRAWEFAPPFGLWVAKY